MSTNCQKVFSFRMESQITVLNDFVVRKPSTIFGIFGDKSSECSNLGAKLFHTPTGHVNEANLIAKRN